MDVGPSTTAPDVTSDAVPRKSKHRQRLAPTTQSTTPDVATVASPVSAIERLDNLIKVITRFTIEALSKWHDLLYSESVVSFVGLTLLVGWQEGCSENL